MHLPFLCCCVTASGGRDNVAGDEYSGALAIVCIEQHPLAGSSCVSQSVCVSFNGSVSLP